MDNSSKPNNQTIIYAMIFLVFLLAIFVGDNIFKHSYLKGNDNIEKVTKDLKKYFETKYDVELSDENAAVSYFGDNIALRSDCDYNGLFDIKDDLSYRVQICKKGWNYKVDFDEDVYKMRKELYSYIKKIKGNGYVENYLQFYGNGIENSIISDLEVLRYVVFDNDNKVLTEDEIKSDYMILKKARELYKKYNIDNIIKTIDVSYINDPIIKTDSSWIHETRFTEDISFDENSYWCWDGDNDEYQYRSCRYKIAESITDDHNENNINYLTYEQFREKANSLSRQLD